MRALHFKVENFIGLVKYWNSCIVESCENKFNSRHLLKTVKAYNISFLTTEKLSSELANSTLKPKPNNEIITHFYKCRKK